MNWNAWRVNDQKIFTRCSPSANYIMPQVRCHRSSSARPEDLHKMLNSRNCCIDPAPAARQWKQSQLAPVPRAATHNLTTTRDLCDRLYLAAPTPDNNS